MTRPGRRMRWPSSGRSWPEAEYLSETVCTVTVLDGPGGTIEAGRDSLDTVYGVLFPIWMLQET